MIDVFMEQPKCPNDEFCSHGPGDHDEGACYYVTNTNLINENNVNKYCKCIITDNIRRFERLGFMPQTEHDSMITKRCSTCGIAVMLRTDEVTCMTCKELSGMTL